MIQGIWEIQSGSVLANHLPPSDQGLIDPLVQIHRAIQADEMAIFLRRRKHRAGRDADALHQRPPAQCRRIDSFRQLHPDHEAAVRLGDAGAWRKINADRPRHSIHRLPVLVARLTQMALVVALGQHFRDRQLRVG